MDGWAGFFLITLTEAEQRGLHYITSPVFWQAFWFVIVVELPRFFLSTLLICWQQLRYPKSNKALPLPYRISVILPMHNFEDCGIETLVSLKEQVRVTLEVIVINDGSTMDLDARFNALKSQGYIDQYVSLKTRGGKAPAVNLGVSLAKYPFLFITDSDTTFQPHALYEALQYFNDPSVGAVGGMLHVKNDDSLVSIFQSINYGFSIYFGRILRDMLGFFFVASGAHAVFRKSAVEKIGGWDFGPGEDGDISTRLRISGYKVRFAPLSQAYTEVPDTWPTLGRQRLRWDRSAVRQRFRKFRWIVLNPFRDNFKPVLALSFLDIYFFQLLPPLLFILYLSSTIYTYGAYSLQVMWAVQLFYIALGLIKYMGLILLSAHYRRRWYFIFYVPVYSIANVYFLRIIKAYATLNELIFRGSYTDSYIPKKVRDIVRRY